MSLGVPKSLASQAIDQIEKWSKCSGDEWTVERLKDIKLYHLAQIGKARYKPKTWMDTRPNGDLKGPLGAAIRSVGRNNPTKFVTSLNGFTAFVAKSLTEKQRQKFFGSMLSEDRTGLNSTLSYVGNTYEFEKVTFRPPTLPEYCTSDKRGPGGDGRMKNERNFYEMFLHAARSYPIRRVIAKHERIFRKVIPTAPLFDIQPHHLKDHNHSFGTISGIQEPGYKLRAIANPNRVIQAVLEPLKARIMAELRTYSTDCTFDQFRGAQDVQRWLQNNKKVDTIDLTDATNLFPWPLQRDLLYRKFPSYGEYIDIMDAAATGPWKTRLRGEEELVSFTRGQPLGLGPSFACFAMAHNLLLRGVCRQTGYMEDDLPFRVLGDDVVISDERVARKYRETLRNLGCQISDSKTFRSRYLAEFAGYSVTPSAILKGYKWRAISEHSLIPMLQVFGKKGLALCNPSQRKLVNKISRVPKPFGPGWADGMKLDQYLETDQGKIYLDHMISDKDRPTVFRDLVADLSNLIRFASNSGENVMVYIQPEDVWKQTASSIDQWMDYSTPPKFDSQSSRPLCLLSSEENRDYWRDRGYYPFESRSGDPRPNYVPFLRSIIEKKKIQWHRLEKTTSQNRKMPDPMFIQLTPKKWQEINEMGGFDKSSLRAHLLEERQLRGYDPHQVISFLDKKEKVDMKNLHSMDFGLY